MALTLAIVSCSAFASTVQMNDLDKELMPGWDIHFTDSNYRNLNLHFNDQKEMPRWAEIIDDAGQRYGLAYLIDMENESLIVTRANTGFLNAGVHYVQPRITEQQNRYNWNDLLSKANFESSQFSYQQKLNADLKRSAFEKQTEIELEQRATWYRNYEQDKFQKKTAANNKTLSEHLEKSRLQMLALRRSYRDRTVKLEGDYKSKERHLQNNFNEQALNLEQERNQLVLSMEEKEVELELAHALKMESLTEEQKLAAEEKAKYKALINHTEKNAQAAELQSKYFPQADRYVASGSARSALGRFFLRYWNYELVWSDELVLENTLKQLQVAKPIRFTDSIQEADLRRDVSVIACTLTRDTPYLTFYTEIDPSSRVVFMQLHQTSEDLRKQIISQCY